MDDQNQGIRSPLGGIKRSGQTKQRASDARSGLSTAL
jgi:hypothetical protein